ncbi:MAG TPA: ABC transporter ATP-binding protein, partial [Solimonas sp.]|nr:ABC transporter ATP-binding protein [Solimonas sp.]
EFLDNVVTRSLVFEGDGRVADSVGGYADWLRQRQAGTAPAAPPRGAAPPPARPAQKLDARSRRELDELPARIEHLETEQDGLARELADPAVRARGREEIAKLETRLRLVEAEHAKAYARWEELEARRNS